MAKDGKKRRHSDMDESSSAGASKKRKTSKSKKGKKERPVEERKEEQEERLEQEQEELEMEQVESKAESEEMDVDSDSEEDNILPAASEEGNALARRPLLNPALLSREPKLPKTLLEKENNRRLIVVLESACLETVKFGNGFQLLNCDDHISILRKKKRDLAEARPDITHQCLLNLLDSPLNKAGMLKIYIHTKRKVLIDVNPKCRIPRTFKRFSGLMVQLLHKMSIKAQGGNEKLLQLVKNPVTQYFPASARRFGLSQKSSKLVDPREWAGTVNSNEPVVLVIGAFAKGKIDVDYIEEEVAISQYPLSAAGVCGKMTSAFEYHWGVL
mmetsp:Transcript_21281/g.82614  ORF Transcript_21281/g.82614 Transcript_21281/m.82614 type:complete len:328 (+) Transcript_21281:53-1036(+)